MAASRWAPRHELPSLPLPNSVHLSPGSSPAVPCCLVPQRRGGTLRLPSASAFSSSPPPPPRIRAPPLSGTVASHPPGTAHRNTRRGRRKQEIHQWLPPLSSLLPLFPIPLSFRRPPPPQPPPLDEGDAAPARPGRPGPAGAYAGRPPSAPTAGAAPAAAPPVSRSPSAHRPGSPGRPPPLPPRPPGDPSCPGSGPTPRGSWSEPPGLPGARRGLLLESDSRSPGPEVPSGTSSSSSSSSSGARASRSRTPTAAPPLVPPSALSPPRPSWAPRAAGRREAVRARERRG